MLRHSRGFLVPLQFFNSFSIIQRESVNKNAICVFKFCRLFFRKAPVPVRVGTCSRRCSAIQLFSGAACASEPVEQAAHKQLLPAMLRHPRNPLPFYTVFNEHLKTDCPSASKHVRCIRASSSLRCLRCLNFAKKVLELF